MAKRKSIVLGICATGLVVLLAAGCAPQQAKSDGGPATADTAGSAATEETVAVDMGSWSADSDCATCHANEDESASDAACLASNHAQQECISCHADTDALTTLHQAAKSSDASKLKRLKEPMSSEACLSCHGSWEELAAKTADSTSLTDKAGRTVNPHDVPKTEGHDEATCFNCHSIHKEADEPGSYCKSCHHEDLYECGTCH